jgi:putative nucleotidyltransferase with HDIG domain
MKLNPEKHEELYPVSKIRQTGSVLKLKLFFLQFAVLASMIVIAGYAEFNRWLDISKNFIDQKGAAMVKTIEPRVLTLMAQNNKNELEELLNSLTSENISHNDVLAVQILDEPMHKVAESSSKDLAKGGGLFHFPATVVFAHPLIDSVTKEKAGYLRFVFSRSFLENQKQAIFFNAFGLLLLAAFISLLMTSLLFRVLNRPVQMLAQAATRIANGELDIFVEADEIDEVGILVESFNHMSKSINVHLQELRNRNIELEKRTFELSTLQQVGRSLSAQLDQESLFESIVDNLINILSGVKRCSLMLVDESRKNFIIKVAKGLEPGIIPASRLVPVSQGIAGKVFNTGDSVLLNDLEEDDDSTELEPARVTRSSICVPIKLEGLVVGVLSVSNRLSGTAFAESDLRLVEGIAKEAAVALKNAGMWRDLERRVLQLNTLHEVGKTLGMVLDIDKLLELVLDLTAKVLGGVKTSSVILHDEETDSLQVMLYKGEKNIDALQPIRVGEGIAGKVFANSEPVIINDAGSSDDSDRKTGRSSMCVPLKIKDKSIGVLSVSDKANGEPFDHEDLEILLTLASQISVTLYNAQLYEDLEASYLSAVRALANSIDAKDPYTRGHSERVARYSIEIGRVLGLGAEDIKTLHVGALLHDIGKISISESIINKDSKLTDSEYETMKTHPSRGAEIIEPAKFLREKVPLIKYHHERFDGKGYPSGLKGMNIPLMARIICVADSYDAMTSKRAYRDIMPREEARNELIRCSGTQFDPKMVNAFLEVLQDENKIAAIEKLGK